MILPSLSYIISYITRCAYNRSTGSLPSQCPHNITQPHHHLLPYSPISQSRTAFPPRPRAKDKGTSRFEPKPHRPYALSNNAMQISHATPGDADCVALTTLCTLCCLIRRGPRGIGRLHEGTHARTLSVCRLCSRDCVEKHGMVFLF